MTITLADAATMAAGYTVSVANQSAGDITVALATATDTIDTVTNTTINIPAKEIRRYIVNASANGYLTAGGFKVHSVVTASLGSDVALNNTSNYFTGPSVAQGTSGTWFASGCVTVHDTAGAANFKVKLWDGTTVIASSYVNADVAAATRTVHLSGYITSPAGNIRISVNDQTSTSGAIVFNSSGNSKDSTITAIRIA